MKHWPRLAVGLALALALFAAVLGGYASVVWSTLDAERRALLAPLAAATADTWVLLAAMLALALGLALAPLYRNYAVAALRLAQGTRLIATANPAHRVPVEGSAELQEVAHAVNLLAARHERAREDGRMAMQAARQDLEHEKNRLAALVGELPQAVIVCNLDGGILLYNTAARVLFTGSGPPVYAGPAGLLGLGRSVFSFLDRALIAHALDRLQGAASRGEPLGAVHFATTTGSGLVRAQLAPVLGAGGLIEGYILTFSGTPGEFDAERERHGTIAQLTETGRAALANVRAAAEALEAAGGTAEARRAAFLRVIREETDALAHRLVAAGLQYEQAVRARWPLDDLPCGDLLQAARAHLETSGAEVTVENAAGGAWARSDSYALLHVLAFLARRLGTCHPRPALFLRATLSRHYVCVDLGSREEGASSAPPADWETAPVADSGELAGLGVRQLVERQGGAVWYKINPDLRERYFRLLLAPGEPAAHRAGTLAGPDSRPEFYDFDLFYRTARTAHEHERLDALSYTVFDTETTGLEPSNGDEIIAIGAVRIVNGRILAQETFEQLVDPQRPISPGATRITGIDATMLRGQPTIDRVLPGFHRYCENTVLVAHNAAFDLRFLQLKEARTGVRFTQPVLDTLLLSAVLHPELDSHKLEAIAERHGVDVLGRHTALGDALLTAEVFVRMLPQLAERGILTLGDAQRAALKTYYARVHY